MRPLPGVRFLCGAAVQKSRGPDENRAEADVKFRTENLSFVVQNGYFDTAAPVSVAMLLIATRIKQGLQVMKERLKINGRFTEKFTGKEESKFKMSC